MKLKKEGRGGIAEVSTLDAIGFRRQRHITGWPPEIALFSGFTSVNVSPVQELPLAMIQFESAAEFLKFADQVKTYADGILERESKGQVQYLLDHGV